MTDFSYLLFNQTPEQLRRIGARQSSSPQPAGASADPRGPALRSPSSSAAPDCGPSPRRAGRAVSLALRCRETQRTQTSPTDLYTERILMLRFQELNSHR